RNVVQLEIEEHAPAALAERAHHVRSGGGEQLETDLGQLGPRPERLVERERALELRHVERDRDLGNGPHRLIHRGHASSLRPPWSARPSTVASRSSSPARQSSRRFTPWATRNAVISSRTSAAPR